MPDVQGMLDIAARHATRMADAMVAACLAWAAANGVTLRPPAPATSSPSRGARPDPDADLRWRRMVEGNGDTRWTHV